MRTWDSEGRPRTTRALSLSLRSADVLPQKTPCLRGYFFFFDGAWLAKCAAFGQAARKQVPVHRIHGLLIALRRPVFSQCGLVIPPQIRARAGREVWKCCLPLARKNRKQHRKKTCWPTVSNGPENNSVNVQVRYWWGPSLFSRHRHCGSGSV